MQPCPLHLHVISLAPRTERTCLFKCEERQTDDTCSSRQRQCRCALLSASSHFLNILSRALPTPRNSLVSVVIRPTGGETAASDGGRAVDGVARRAAERQ